mgnify:CR=1 FL=1
MRRLVLLAAVVWGRPAAAQIGLTIYNDGRVLVRRSVAANIPKGNSNQRLTLGALDPATIFSLDSSVNLQRVSYDGAVDEASVLRRSVGKRLVFRLSDPRDTVSALVLGVDPLRLTNVSMAATAASLPVTILPMLVLMNDGDLLQRHTNGWLANAALGLLAALSIVLLVVALPLQLLGG